jgi:hypothetical protein
MTTRSNNRGAGAARRCSALVVLMGIALALRGPSMLFAEAPGIPPALTQPDAPIPLDPATPQANSLPPPQDEAEKKKLERQAAEGELHEEEHQHFLGFIPYFNTVNGDAAPPLSPSEKFELAFRRSIAPQPLSEPVLSRALGRPITTFRSTGRESRDMGNALVLSMPTRSTATCLAARFSPLSCTRILDITAWGPAAFARDSGIP